MNEMGGALARMEGRRLHGFGGKTSWEESTRKTQTQIGV